MDPIKINLGCGNDIRPGYTNIDLVNLDPRVKKADVRNLDFLESILIN